MSIVIAIGELPDCDGNPTPARVARKLRANLGYIVGSGKRSAAVQQAAFTPLESMRKDIGVLEAGEVETGPHAEEAKAGLSLR